jgi:hypothetical protein
MPAPPAPNEAKGRHPFDGKWEMVRLGQNCTTPTAPRGNEYIVQLTIKNGEILGRLGAGGTHGSVSASGELRLTHLANGTPGTTRL